MYADFQDFWLRHNNDVPEEELLKLLKCTLATIIILGILFCCSGCGAAKQTTQEYIEHKDSTNYSKVVDSIFKTIVTKDSIFVRDSIFIREKEDTVFIEKWHNYTKLLATHDTIYKTHTDTLYLFKDSSASTKQKDVITKEEPWYKKIVTFIIAASILWLIVISIKWARNE